MATGCYWLFLARFKWRCKWELFMYAGLNGSGGLRRVYGASKPSCSYCHNNVQSKAAGWASYCSSFTSFQFVSGKKGGSFLFPKRGETQVSRYGKKSHALFSPLLFSPITIFSSAVFCSLEACLLRHLSTALAQRDRPSFNAQSAAWRKIFISSLFSLSIRCFFLWCRLLVIISFMLSVKYWDLWVKLQVMCLFCC